MNRIIRIFDIIALAAVMLLLFMGCPDKPKDPKEPDPSSVDGKIPVSITITFEQLEDDNFWGAIEPLEIPHTSGAQIVLTLTGTYTSIEWFVDGILNTAWVSNNDKTFTLDPANFNRTGVGLHTLTVEAANGKTYNRTVPFTVLE